MKKILFMIKNLEMGGVSKAFINILKCINLDKYEVTVVSLFEKNDYGHLEDLIDDRIKRKVVFKDNKSVLINKLYGRILKHLSGKSLYKLFIKEDYDVEISFITNYPNKIIANSTNKSSKKIGWIHGNYDYCNYDLELYKNEMHQKETYKKFNTIVCVANECKKAFDKNITSQNTTIIHNPIDSKEIILLSKESINLKDNDQFIICSVGRLSEEKGFLRLLKIHNKLKKDGFNHRLWIVGDGPQREELERYIEEHNLHNSVNLLGYQKNPYKFMKNSNLYVCPSYTEALSTTIQEFLILEKPVITTRCSGMIDLLGDSEFGLITENTEDELYKGLKSLLENSELLDYYQKKAIERSNYFKIEKSIEKIDRLLSLNESEII